MVTLSLGPRAPTGSSWPRARMPKRHLFVPYKAGEHGAGGTPAPSGKGTPKYLAHIHLLVF